MNNVIPLPQTARVRVTQGRDKETGRRIYVFELVEGGMRNVIATHTDIQRMTNEIEYLIAEGYDVAWDNPELLMDGLSVSVIPMAGQ
jgi:hypothetical protein